MRSRESQAAPDQAASAGATPSGHPPALSRLLARAAVDVVTLDVQTCDARAARGDDSSEPPGPRAATRIAADGTVDVCLPTTDGALDDDLWRAHREMLDQALTQRAWLISRLSQIAAGRPTAPRDTDPSTGDQRDD